jgi:hypothetical protein
MPALRIEEEFAGINWWGETIHALFDRTGFRGRA